MTIIVAVAGPSTRAAHGNGMCLGLGTGLNRVNSFASVWSERKLPHYAVQPFPSQRPRPDAVSILDPQRVSAPPRRSP